MDEIEATRGVDERRPVTPPSSPPPPIPSWWQQAFDYLPKVDLGSLKNKIPHITSDNKWWLAAAAVNMAFVSATRIASDIDSSPAIKSASHFLVLAQLGVVGFAIHDIAKGYFKKKQYNLPTAMIGSAGAAVFTYSTVPRFVRDVGRPAALVLTIFAAGYGSRYFQEQYQKNQR